MKWHCSCSEYVNMFKTSRKMQTTFYTRLPTWSKCILQSMYELNDGTKRSEISLLFSGILQRKWTSLYFRNLKLVWLVIRTSETVRSVGPFYSLSHAYSRWEPFTQWWEQHILVDDEGEWSYSIAVSSQTMDLLQERFGDGSFREPGPWSGWKGGGRQARWPSLLLSFWLASPKLH